MHRVVTLTRVGSNNKPGQADQLPRLLFEEPCDCRHVFLRLNVAWVKLLRAISNMQQSRQ